MKFKWLSELGPKSALREKFFEKLDDIGTTTNYGKEQILGYLIKENFDALLCFEGKKFVACCAVNRDKKEKNVLRRWLIYTDPAFRRKGYAKALSAELAKRAQAEGFRSAKLGTGGNYSVRILASLKRDRKLFSLRGFKLEPKTGNVTYPRKRKK